MDRGSDRETKRLVLDSGAGGRISMDLRRTTLLYQQTDTSQNNGTIAGLVGRDCFNAVLGEIAQDNQS